MRRRASLLTCLAALWSGPLCAQGDPRLQTLPYAVGAVFGLRVAPGYVATIGLGEDERIESVAVGNSAAWEVTPNKSGDHLFVKPLATGVSTNLEVVTNARHYSFLLQSTFDGDPQAVFQLRFAYPPEAGSAPVAPSSAVVTGGVAVATVEPVTARYRLSGAYQARPAAMDDDGAHTRFRFADGASLPAIYAIDEQGRELLVTARHVDDTLVVDRVWRRYVFRIGKATAQARRVSDKGDRR